MSKNEERPLFSDFYKLELSQVVDRIGAIESVRLQLGSFFGTANLTAIGIAFSSQKAGIFLIASILLLIFVILDTRAFVRYVVYVYRGLQLPEKFAPNDAETFLRLQPSIAVNEAQKIVAIGNVKQRRQQLLRLGISPRRPLFWLPLFIAIGEGLTGLLLWLRLGWVLF